MDHLKAAELHWFFVQGEQAVAEELYVPGCVSLLNGIEASLRVTMHQLDRKGLSDQLGPTLSNPLIHAARERGVPVSELAFPNEHDFHAKLVRKEPYVEVVRLRHNLAHGNIFEFINKDLGIFTPECLRETAENLLAIARGWTKSLGEFRSRSLRYA